MSKKKKEPPITAAPHIWKPGHDPNDPDAYVGSGWEYLTLKSLESSAEPRNDKYAKAGGPESGLPCMHCHEMTRIVDDVPALDFFDSTVDFTEEQKKKFADARVAILLCPKCESITQMRADVVQVLRTKWLLRQK